jgi:hypothetical protein
MLRLWSDQLRQMTPEGTMAKPLSVLALALLVAACSRESVVEPPSTAPPTAPSPSPTYRWPLHATVRLTANGPEPATVIINVGARVEFVNDDSRAYEVLSDPELRHDECPVINRVGFLSPGQRRETGVFESVRTCGFHDHFDPTGVRGRLDVRIE